MVNCPICQELAKNTKKVFQNEHWSLREAIGKNLDGYLYLESREHKESWLDVKLNEWEDYGRALYQACQILREKSPKKIYQIAIAEKVPHLHLHLVPRYTDSSKGIEYIGQAIGPGLPPNTN